MTMTMRYSRAVERLRLLADACQEALRLPRDTPFLHEAYVFGDILDGADPVECVNVAFTLDLPPDEIPWCSQPPETAWLVHDLRWATTSSVTPHDSGPSTAPTKQP